MILKTFGSKSGGIINLSKSCAFYLGASKKYRKTVLRERAVWPATCVKYLGINLPKNQINDLHLLKENFNAHYIKSN